MHINELRKHLLGQPRTWFITGVAGFIGSNLAEELLKLGQTVTGMDNFSSGYQHNLDDIQSLLGQDEWKRFTFFEGDIRNIDDCRRGCEGADIVLHHAAFISVPQSMEDPLAATEVNVNGFINMLTASRDVGVARLVYASSSAVYGDSPDLPKVESAVGVPLSPYAITKHANELYANIYAGPYSVDCVGLRYFNVFGKRQDPNGAYAAVITRWVNELANGKVPTINGDGETTRDFCYISNVVEANLLAAITENPEAVNQVYNIASGSSITLEKLFEIIRESVSRFKPGIAKIKPGYADFRPGDVRYSEADISKAKQLLEFNPAYGVADGLNEVIQWQMTKG